MIEGKSRKNTRFYTGALENAGLGEVAYFLKQAKRQVSYANFALDNTSFDFAKARVKDAESRIARLNDMIRDLTHDIDQVERSVADEVFNKEFYGSEDE